MKIPKAIRAEPSGPSPSVHPASRRGKMSLPEVLLSAVLMLCAAGGLCVLVWFAASGLSSLWR